MMNRTKLADLPALKFLSLYVCGILTAHVIKIPFSLSVLTTPIIFIASSVAVCVKKIHTSTCAILIMVTIIMTGVLRYTYHEQFVPPDHTSTILAKNDIVLLQGIVSNYPVTRDSVTTFRMSVSNLILTDSTSIAICGELLVKCWFHYDDLHIYDEIKVIGRVRLPRGERNPGEFDYKAYLKSAGIHQLLYVYRNNDLFILQKRQTSNPFQHIVPRTREFIDTRFKQNFQGQERAIIKGLILGDRNEIDPDLKSAFSAAGVMHVLAVSGLHVGFVVMIITWIVKFMRTPYRLNLIITMFSVFFYMRLIGFNPPVARASTIVILYVFGRLLQREVNTINLLSTAALIILIIDPIQLFQASFQLSFAAVLSILIIYQKMSLFLSRSAWYLHIQNSKVLKYMFDLFLVSVAVSLGTAPLTMHYFEKLPLISLFLNILIVPLVGIIIGLGFLHLILSLISSSVSAVIVHITSLCLRFLIKSVQISAGMDFGYLEIYGFQLLHVIGLYIFIFLLIMSDQIRFRKAMLFYVLIMLNSLSWSKYFHEENYMEIVFFDVGQGDGALIKTPDNHYAVIDGGDANDDYSSGQRFLYPYLKRHGIHELDFIILTHGDNDHVGGLPFLLRNVRVKSVIDNGILTESDNYLDYLKVIDSLNIEHRTVKAGEYFDFGEEISCFVLHPSDGEHYEGLNNTSLVLKLVYGNTHFLFTGDIESEVEKSLLRYGDLLKCDILKVAHHGSRSSSIQSFLEYASPAHAVISVGEYNRFNHPSPVVLERFNRLHINIHRTDLTGAIIFRSNGKTLWHVPWYDD